MRYIITIPFLLASSLCFANYESYDDIVDKLSSYKNNNKSRLSNYSSTIPAPSTVHAGLGVSRSFFDLNTSGTRNSIENQGGLIINLGIDVLSRSWGVEGSFANFGTNQNGLQKTKLREFAIKGLYKPKISRNWRMRMGVGFSSRFLDVTASGRSANYKTPSGLFSFGLDKYISRFFSIGADFGFKTAMIDDTIDKTSVDLAIRMDTHF